MKSALSIFEGGILIHAFNTDLSRIRTKRPVCPECLEPVFFVSRENGSYFSHWPATPSSPHCSLRRESSGTSGLSHNPRTPNPSNLFDKELFQDVLLSVYRIDFIRPLPKGAGKYVTRLMTLMHGFWQKKRKCLEAADLPANPPISIQHWETSEHLIRYFSGQFSKKNDKTITTDIFIQSLAKPEQVQTALMIWKHLHLEQSARDLLLIFRLAFQLSKDKYSFLQAAEKDEMKESDFPHFAAALMVMGMSLITRTPWLEMTGLLKAARKTFRECGACGALYNTAAANAGKPCSACGKPTCPACGVFCKTCNHILCLDHASSHQTWSCENCKIEFCTGEIPPTQKIISSCCQKTYCKNCGEYLSCIECGKEPICYACGQICPGCDGLLCDKCTEFSHRCDFLTENDPD